MLLFIACILLTMMEAHWGWYVFAAVLWGWSVLYNASLFASANDKLMKKLRGITVKL